MKEPRNRVSIIGAGIIAESRVPALRAAGLEVAAVSSRQQSTRVKEFATRFGIPVTFDSWQAMLKGPRAWDAVVISTWPDGTPEVLEAFMSTGVPVLVEKPVAWNSRTLRRLCALPHENVRVGYNRRYYASVQRAREFVVNGGPVLAHLTVPTNVTPPDELQPSGRYMQEFYESVSILGVDLTRFVLGDLSLKYVQRMKSKGGNNSAIAAIYSTERGDVLQVSCMWGTSSNYGLVLSRRVDRFELLPFEIGSLYQGMEVMQPTPEYPIRRYLPRVTERVMLDGIDLQEKPGFYAESANLKAMIDGQPGVPFAARLEDALAATVICEQITGVELGDTNPTTYHH